MNIIIYFSKLKIIFNNQSFTYVSKTTILGYPTTLSIEPTTSCNLTSECPSGLRSLRNDRDVGICTLKKITPIKNDYCPPLGFQGEFLHPKFLEMIRYADKSGYLPPLLPMPITSMKNVDQIIDSGLKHMKKGWMASVRKYMNLIE